MNKRISKTLTVLILASLLLTACRTYGGTSDMEESKKASSTTAVTIDETKETSSNQPQSTDTTASSETAKAESTAEHKPETNSGLTSAVTKEAMPTKADESSVDEEALTVFKAVSNYAKNKGSDYIAYQKKNPKFSAEQVVAYVNLGLNREFYTGIQTIADPDDLLVLCSKYFALPADYEPSDLVEVAAEASTTTKTLYLRKEAAIAFEKLVKEAKAQGYDIIGQSGYRSYTLQTTLYNNYVTSDGKANADRYSARPGHSEHQTGLAMDVRTPTGTIDNFGTFKEYDWLKKNAHNYGFVLHFTEGSEWITGYMTEEWHIRYVGVEHAKKVYEKGITLDEYIISLQR